MSTPTRPSTQALIDHERRLAEVCPMTVSRWRTLKALVFSALLTGVATLSILENADPTIIGSVTLVGIVLFFGLELKEVELASLLTITFKNGHDEDEKP